MLEGKRILLVIGGGIAAYKSLELIRLLTGAGAAVTPVMTKAAHEFVTPLSVASLAGEKVYEELFNLTDEAEMGHIRLSRRADLVVCAPATAHMMARLAAGLADDLPSTLLLATDKQILMAPAMNVRMWEHSATQRNLARLREDGIVFVGPNEGDMACGEYGLGRMSEPLEILAAITTLVGGARKPLAGKRVLVTSGPTHEPIDPVRYIANRSSGKQGHAIAAALATLGADTVLVTGPTQLRVPAGVTVVRVETAREMLDACLSNLPVDACICVAAVADWRVAECGAQKMKKTEATSAPRNLSLDLVENPDILATLSAAGPKRPRLVVGFAAETENLIAHAREKLKRKGCDWVIANDVSANSGVMGGENNSVHLVTHGGEESWPLLDKTEVGRRLALRIGDYLNGAGA
jgi:phosphopantothenoylcysteine decarboxylase/phosphopantothenate--cysteine ligase